MLLLESEYITVFFHLCSIVCSIAFRMANSSANVISERAGSLQVVQRLLSGKYMDAAVEGIRGSWDASVNIFECEEYLVESIA